MADEKPVKSAAKMCLLGRFSKASCGVGHCEVVVLPHYDRYSAHYCLPRKVL